MTNECYRKEWFCLSVKQMWNWNSWDAQWHFLCARLSVKGLAYIVSLRPHTNVYYTDEENASHSVVSDSLWPHELYSPWNSPGQNTGVGVLSLLQGLFPTQGLNPGLPHCRQILFFFFNCSGFCHTLKWISHGFTCVPHPDPPSHLPLHPIPLGLPSAPGPSACLIADRFFTSWATREGHRWGSWASIR